MAFERTGTYLGTWSTDRSKDEDARSTNTREMRVVLEYTLAIFPRLALFAYILSAVGHLLTTIASSFLGSSKCILSVK